MHAEFDVTLDYGQLFVSDPSAPSAGLLWEDDHVSQGFAWAPGLACFGVPDHDGDCLVRVSVAETVEIEAECIWALRVPYAVTGILTIGGVADGRRVRVPSGYYGLHLKGLPGNGDRAYVLDVAFCTDIDMTFAVLKRGGELGTDVVLRRDAEYA